MSFVFSELLSLRVGSVVALLVFTSSVMAQEVTTLPGDGPLPKELTGGISVTEQFNDNIFSTRNNKVGDAITLIAPWLDFTHDGSMFDFSIGGSAELGRYALTPTEDYDDYRLYLDTTSQLAPNVQLFAGASHAQDHEERSSPDDVNGTMPTIYELTHAYGAVLARSGPNSVKVGGTFDRYSFDDNGPVNNDDRDRSMASAGARLDHRVSTVIRLYIEGAWDGRQYDTGVDDAGFDRDSDGVRVAGGIIQRLTPTVRSEIYGGWIYQDYDDSRLRDVSTADFGGRVRWRPAQGSLLNLSLGRSVEETTLAGVSSYVRTELSATFRQNVTERMRVAVSATYSDNDYQGIARADRVLSFVADGRYYLTPHVFAGLSYEFQNRDSTAIVNNYDQSKIMARLGVDLQTAYKETATHGLLAERGKGLDLYVGGKIGVAAPGTDLLGPRGNGGTLQADFADLGLAGSFYAGLGTTYNKWYVGLEADVTLSDADWDHARRPGGRVFGVENDVSYGLSALFGRKLIAGSMLFGRAGFKVAEFDTTYFTAMGTPFPHKGSEFGLRLGTGLQAPVSPHLSVRMEYEYTAFDDYNVVTPPGTDNFANTESLMSVGLSFHLNPAASTSNAAGFTLEEPTRFDGFYAGVQGGHGAFVSRTTGPRNAGSTLTADFGDAGLTGGVFGGYAAQLGRFVVGAEVEAELSDAGWDHTRDPTGRSYAVDKQYTIGAAGRIGFVAGDLALIYARAGVVGSGLKYRFDRGMQSIKRTRMKAGLRVGLGMEVPVTDSMFVRADLTYSDYGKTSLTVPGAGNGTERYKTTESLYRLGAVFRF